MQAPKWFVERLRSEHTLSPLRIRWSEPLHEWLIEERVGRASRQPRPAPRHPLAAEWFKAKQEGYRPFLSVRPSPAPVPCRSCGSLLPVPVMTFKLVVCPKCGFKTALAYFPLNDRLLAYLRSTSPESDVYDRALKEVDGAMEAKEIADRRKFRRETEAVWKEDYNRLVGIPQFGYTGKEYAHA